MTPPASGWGAAAPWLRGYPAGVPPTYQYPSVPATRLLDDAAQDFPDVVAIEYRRYRLSYRKLLDHADRLATAITRVGVAAGDRVALVLPNCPQLVIALFATWRIGAAAVLHTPATEPSALVAAEPRLIVTLDRWYGTVVAPNRRALPGHAGVVITSRGDYLPFPRNVLAPLRGWLRAPPRRIPQSAGVLRFAELIRRSLPAPEEGGDTPDRIAVAERSAPLSQAQLVTNSFQVRLWLPDVVAGDERFLLSVPLASSLGAVWMLTAVLSASTMVLIDEGRAALRQRSAFRAKPTILPLNATVAYELLRSSWRRGNLNSVRIAVSTDDYADDTRSQLEELTDKGRIRRAWGVRGMLTHADPVYGRATPGTVGLPLPDTEAVVTDPADPAGVVPVGERGRLWLRGPQLCGPAWLDTDLEATVEPDGYLRLHR